MPMGLNLIIEEMPSLAPIKTSTTAEYCFAAEKVTVEENEENCVTPKSEESKLKPTLVCPLAPRKPRPAKRKVGPPPHGFYNVPRDLTSVFIPVSSRTPKSKRIRLISHI